VNEEEKKEGQMGEPLPQFKLEPVNSRIQEGLVKLG
jgi:hypothetical protein